MTAFRLPEASLPRTLAENVDPRLDVGDAGRWLHYRHFLVRYQHSSGEAFFQQLTRWSLAGCVNVHPSKGYEFVVSPY
jgi:hypothetical protein